MQIDGTDNIPFSLFISAQRRRKILSAMWSDDEKTKKEGEKILGNYKKQLAEKLARDTMDSSYVESRPISGVSRMSRCTIKTKKSSAKRKLSRNNTLNNTMSSMNSKSSK